jgi:hypothetical protein
MLNRLIDTTMTAVAVAAVLALADAPVSGQPTNTYKTRRHAALTANPI